jgi:hypothetical protein
MTRLLRYEDIEKYIEVKSKPVIVRDDLPSEEHHDCRISLKAFI